MTCKLRLINWILVIDILLLSWWITALYKIYKFWHVGRVIIHSGCSFNVLRWTYIFFTIYTMINIGAFKVMIVVIGNGIGDMNCLCFTFC